LPPYARDDQGEPPQKPGNEMCFREKNWPSLKASSFSKILVSHWKGGTRKGKKKGGPRRSIGAWLRGGSGMDVWRRDLKILWVKA